MYLQTSCYLALSWTASMFRLPLPGVPTVVAEQKPGPNFFITRENHQVGQGDGVVGDGVEGVVLQGAAPRLDGMHEGGVVPRDAGRQQVGVHGGRARPRRPVAAHVAAGRERGGVLLRRHRAQHVEGRPVQPQRAGRGGELYFSDSGVAGRQEEMHTVVRQVALEEGRREVYSEVTVGAGDEHPQGRPVQLIAVQAAVRDDGEIRAVDGLQRAAQRTVSVPVQL